VVVGVFNRRKPSPQAQLLDDASGGAIGSVMRRGDMDGKLGQTAMLHNLPGLFCDRILLIGCGKEREFEEQQYRKALRSAAQRLDKVGGVDAANYLTELNVKGCCGCDPERPLQRPPPTGFSWFYAVSVRCCVVSGVWSVDVTAVRPVHCHTQLVVVWSMRPAGGMW
jgi:hypothetical protein